MYKGAFKCLAATARDAGAQVALAARARAPRPSPSVAVRFEVRPHALRDQLHPPRLTKSVADLSRYGFLAKTQLNRYKVETFVVEDSKSDDVDEAS